MDINQALQLLQDAQGDPARLALATVEIALASQPAAEQDALRAALEAAAIPHWFDAELLDGILDESLKPRAVELAERLCDMPFVESFATRGECAANVHEATRLALRARLAKENPERLRELSRRVLTALPAPDDETAAPHLRIEALYHGLIGYEEKVAARASRDLFFLFWERGDTEAFQALAIMLIEIAEHSPVAGLVRAEVLLRLAISRESHQSTEDTVTQLHEALQLSEEAGDEYRISASLDSLARFHRAHGHHVEALELQQQSLAIDEARLAQDPDNLDLRGNVLIGHNEIGIVYLERRELDEALIRFRQAEALARQGIAKTQGEPQWRRYLCAALDRLGDVFIRQDELAPSMAAYREAEGVLENLAKEFPGNDQFQRDLAVCYNKIGEVLARQGDPAAGLIHCRRGEAIRDRFVKKDPDNAAWQDELSTSYQCRGKIQRELGDWEGAAAVYILAREQADEWLSRVDSGVDWYNNFSSTVAALWEAVGDAPAGAIALDHTALLADLRRARELLRRKKAEGRLRHPGDENLSHIERLLQEAEEGSEES